MIDTLAKYLARKGILERCVAVGVAMVLVLLVLNISVQYWDSAKSVNRHSEVRLRQKAIDSDLEALSEFVNEKYREYRVKSLCKKAFCSISNNQDSRVIEMNFSCSDAACYELIREIEDMPRIYITEFSSKPDELDDRKQNIRLMIEKDAV